MRLEGKTIAEIHYKGNSRVWREQRIQDQKARTKVPERDKCQTKTDLWDIQVHIQNIAINI